jgi:hypothetical protein
LNPWNIFDPMQLVESFVKTGFSWLNRFPELMGRADELRKQLQELSIREIPLFFKDDGLEKDSLNDQNVDFMQLVNNVSRFANLYHGVYSRWIKNMAQDTLGIDRDDRRRSCFWITQINSALSLSNYFCTNPGAWKRCIKSKGKSFQSGCDNFLEDLYKKTHDKSCG